VRAVLSLTLAVSLGGSAIAAAAQEEMARPVSFDARGPTPGFPSLAAAVTREAVRLAATTDEPTSAAEDARQTGKPGRSEWSRLRKLAPGTRVIVTIDGAAAGSIRYFVSADDTGLAVLNLTDQTLPVAATRALREIATKHPEYIDSAAKGGTFLVDNLRLASGGVFLADRKIADLQQVVEISERTKVAEVTTLRKGRGVWGHLGPLGGYFVGAVSGGFIAGYACQAVAGRDRCDTGAFLTGGVMGGIAGLGYGFQAVRRETEDVIYRAP
jgi:hypothetical protein